MPTARNIEGVTPREPRQSGWEISDTNTPMLGWVDPMARAEMNLKLAVCGREGGREPRLTDLAAKMIWMEGAVAMMAQVKKRGIPATMVTCLRPNLAERQPPTRQAGRAATR